MNKADEKRIMDNIKRLSIPMEEVFKDFTPEMDARVEAHIRYYDMVKALKESRVDLGLTQSELAAIANLPRTTISKIESGNYNPTLSTLVTIAAAMNKTLTITLV